MIVFDKFKRIEKTQFLFNKYVPYQSEYYKMYFVDEVNKNRTGYVMISEWVLARGGNLNWNVRSYWEMLMKVPGYKKDGIRVEWEPASDELNVNKWVDKK